MKKILVLSLMVIAMSGCRFENILDCYNGDFIKKEVSFEKFSELDVDIPCEIELVNGDKQIIIIEGREDMIRDFEKRSSVFNGELQMRLRNNCIIRSNEIKITMVIPGLKKVDIDGNAKIFSQGKLMNTSDEMNLKVDGNVNANLFIDTKRLIVDVDGNAKISLLGKAERLELKVDGNSTINAIDFIVKNAILDIDGNANVQLNCEETLNARIDGNAKICFKGNPVVTSKISGTGKINSCN